MADNQTPDHDPRIFIGGHEVTVGHGFAGLSLVLGAVVEPVQRHVQELKAVGTPVSDGMAEMLANAPNAGALGLGCMVVGVTGIVCAGRKSQANRVEDAVASMSASDDTAVESWGRRAAKRATVLAAAGAAAWLAYKGGTYLTGEQAIAADLALLSGGFGYLAHRRHR